MLKSIVVELSSTRDIVGAQKLKELKNPIPKYPNVDIFELVQSFMQDFLTLKAVKKSQLPSRMIEVPNICEKKEFSIIDFTKPAPKKAKTAIRVYATTLAPKN